MLTKKEKMWSCRSDSKHGHLFWDNGKMNASSAVYSTSMIPELLGSSGFYVVT